MDMSKTLNRSFSTELEKCYKPLTDAEEIIAIRKAKLGDTNAINALVYSQIKMIISIAKGYASKQNHIDDLVNDGVAGLIENINGYDESFDTVFYTYINRHVANAITYRVYDNTLVRLPRNHSKQKEVQPKYNSDGYIIKEGVEKKTIKAVSIDAPVNDTENAPTFETFIKDCESNTPEQNSIERNVTSLVKKMLHTLNTEEQKVVSMSFGFGEYDVMTFQEIGDAMGKSKQAVNMQLAKIIARIKEPASTII